MIDAGSRAGSTGPRIARWLRDVAVARSSATVEVPGGVAVLHHDYPFAHDHNRLILWPGAANDGGAVEVTAGVVTQAADAVLGGADLTHRMIDVQDLQLADQLDAGLRQAGYERLDEIVLRHDGADTARDRSRQTEVEPLELDERMAVASADWMVEQPEWSAAVVEQLGTRARTLFAAVTPTFLGVRRQGSVVARCDLYVRDGVAQIEEVMTNPVARRQGLARAVVADALGRATESGADEIFLIADAHDWVVEFYRRLGFRDVFRSASFSR